MSAPSGYTALDFVGFTDKGTYSPIVTYMRNDLVHYGGNIMRCLIDNTKNVTPVVGANWELWVGASANLVERVIAPLENNPADVAFGVGRQIIYDDWLWEVIAPIAVGDALVDYAVDPTNANIKKSAPVETQLLAVKAEADATDNMIAPTEANASSSSAAYAVGDQLILNNILYDVIAAIQIGDALITGTGGNIAAADTLTDQLNAKANSSDLAAVATSGSYSDLSNKPTLGTAAAKDSTNAVTSGSTALVESGAVYSEVDSVKQALTTKANGGGTSSTKSVALGYTNDNWVAIDYTKQDDSHIRLLFGNERGITLCDDSWAPYWELHPNLIENANNIAYVNTNSTTASKAYVKGEQFILDGILRKAKSAIASGATLTLNSNYENADTITTQIDNDKNFNTIATSNSKVTIKKNANGNALISANNTTVSLDGTRNQQIDTISSSANYPTSNIYLSGTLSDGGGAKVYPCVLYINNTTGVIGIKQKDVTSSDTLYLNVNGLLLSY